MGRKTDTRQMLAFQKEFAEILCHRLWRPVDYMLPVLTITVKKSEQCLPLDLPVHLNAFHQIGFL